MKNYGTGGSISSPAGVLRERLGGDSGYVLILVMLVLTAVIMMSATLLSVVLVNNQHVARDRTYTQSLAIAEAGLNQYLWMVYAGGSNEANNFIIPGNTGSNLYVKSFAVNDIHDGSAQGSYTMTVTPPSQTDLIIRVRVVGKATSPVDVSRTVEAHIGRPSFSE